MNFKQKTIDLLPRVGDTRMERPLEGKQLEECTVVEVNTVGLWYRVRFKKTGFHECYKVPRLRTLYGEADDQKGT